MAGCSRFPSRQVSRKRALSCSPHRPIPERALSVPLLPSVQSLSSGGDLWLAGSRGTLPPEDGVWRTGVHVVHVCAHACTASPVPQQRGEYFQRRKVLPEEGGQAWLFIFLRDYCSWLPTALKAIPYTGHRPETKAKGSLTCPKSTQDSPANLHREPRAGQYSQHVALFPSSSWSCLLFSPPNLPSFPVSSFFLLSAYIP